MLGVESVQDQCIDKDQRDEDQNAALLGEPEAQREASQMEPVELVREELATAETGRRPDGEQHGHDGEVPTPVTTGGVGDPLVERLGRGTR